MVVYSKRGKRRLAIAFLLGAGSLLCVEGLAVAAYTWPPVSAIAGTAEAAPGPDLPARIPLEPQALAAPTPPRTAPPASPASTPPPSGPAPPSVPASTSQRPNTIRLPEGGTAELVREDIGPDSALPVPQSLGQATWWGAELDAKSGASVFAGHVDWAGSTGPFAELWTERIGGTVTVVDAAGKPWTYRIDQLFTLTKEELPQRANELFGPQGPHRVVLVTCGGEWVGGRTGYADNRVAVADPV